MRKTGVWIGALGGPVVGALVTALAFNLLPTPWLPKSPLPVARLKAMPTRDLARELLGRVGERMVADSRGGFPLTNGIDFYDQPTPMGDHLCLVRIFSVEDSVLEGRPEDRDRGSLRVQDAWGLWRDPSQNPGDHGATARAACAGYRDFRHLIIGDSAARGTMLLDRARDAAVAGKAGFKVICVDDTGDGLKACDGLAVLRAVDLRQVVMSRQLSETEDDEGNDFTDEIIMPMPTKSEHPLIHTFKIKSRREYRVHEWNDGEVLSVEIELQVR